MTSATAELQELLSIPAPNLASHLHANPVAIAHARLEALRDEGDPSFLFLRTVIEINAHVRPDQQELVFHCITGVRQVILFQWSKFSQTFLLRLRDYLMVLGHSIQFRTIRLACYTTSVSVWKRLWIETDNTTTTVLTPSPAEESLIQAMSTANAPHLQSREDLFKYVESLVSTQITEAATFLSTIVTEFGAKSAVNYRLPIEFHKNTHRAFEKEGPLTQCLKLGMGALSTIVTEILASRHNIATETVTKASAIIEFVTDCLSWEFGTTAFDMSLLGTVTLARTLLRPPLEWRQWLTQADFLSAMFSLHEAVIAQHDNMAQAVRQFLLLLASISSAVFENAADSQQYASCLLEGSQTLLNSAVTNSNMLESSQLLDTLQLVGRLLSNFRLASLVELPALMPLLQGVASIGTKLLQDQTNDCEQARGDIESMEHRDWREEALSLLLECTVILSSDPWILYSGTEESRNQAKIQLASVLGPLYEGYVACRTRIAALEEHYLATQEAELDEVREEIEGVDLEEELCSVSTLGRLHLRAAITCLSNHFAQTMPQLQAVWSSTGYVTPQQAAVLEQSRLLYLYMGNLLTDANEGESPAIPDAVVIACDSDPSLATDVAGAVNALVQLAESQVKMIAENPSNMLLSPLIAKSFVWFLHRWAPSYICPSVYSSSNSTNGIILEWSSPEKSQQSVSFCATICIGYLSYWPHESQLQEEVEELLMALSKRKEHVRPLLVASQPFRNLVQLHCLTAGIRHSASREEFETSVNAKAFDPSVLSTNMIGGYHRLPYKTKSKILTAIIVGCSDPNEASQALLSDTLKIVDDSFTSLVRALTAKQVLSDDVHAKEMANLCVHLFGGVVRAGEMTEPTRIPTFISKHLTDLSGLMNFYAADLSICENLIELFRDYTEQFLAFLDHDQSLSLFNATGKLLKSYSEHHISARVVVVSNTSSTEAEVEEEQAYSDIQSTIQLLTNLGTKDFLDLNQHSNPSNAGDNSTTVTDLIFYGLQQLLPLMTQGLLQYPTLCRQFFDLLGFVMETYAPKVCSLPYKLFDSLLEAVLFGMSHHDPDVGKCALEGLASLVREHIQSRALQNHLSQYPDILDRCSRRLLTEVVFGQVVVDRVEAAGNALLPLAAADVNRFAAVVSALNQQMTDAVQRARLEAAFTFLVQPEMMAQVSATGYEGRENRIQFKEAFQVFVKDVHSFLLIK